MNSGLFCLLAFVPKWRGENLPRGKVKTIVLVSIYLPNSDNQLQLNSNNIILWQLYCSHQHSYTLECIVTQNKSLSFAGLVI